MNKLILPTEIDNIILSYLGINKKYKMECCNNFDEWLNNIILMSVITPSSKVMNQYIKSYTDYCNNFFVYSFYDSVFSLATRRKDYEMNPYFNLYEEIKYMYDWDERVIKYGELMKKYNSLYYHSRIIKIV